MQRSLVVNAMSLIVKKVILFVWLITVLYEVSFTLPADVQPALCYFRHGIILFCCDEAAFHDRDSGA